MTRILLDTNVLLYARGKDHHYREPCRGALRAARDGLLELDASVEVTQEFAHVLLRRGIDRSSVLEEISEVMAQVRLIAFDTDVWNVSRTLLGAYPTLGVRDAVHAATAIEAGVSSILSTERVFDGIEEITRIDPAEAEWMSAT